LTTTLTFFLDFNGGGNDLLGLVVHAAADGIALGAAAMGDNHQLEMVVFMAIMLHKAPGSFGLATYLLHEGLTRNVPFFTSFSVTRRT